MDSCARYLPGGLSVLLRKWIGQLDNSKPNLLRWKDLIGASMLIHSLTAM